MAEAAAALARVKQALAEERARLREEEAFSRERLGPALEAARAGVLALEAERQGVEAEFEEGKDLGLIRERCAALQGRRGALEGQGASIKEAAAQEEEARSGMAGCVGRAWEGARRSAVECAQVLEVSEDFVAAGGDAGPAPAAQMGGGMGGVGALVHAALQRGAGADGVLASALRALQDTESQCAASTTGSSSLAWLKAAVTRAGAAGAGERELSALARAIGTEEAALAPMEEKLGALRPLVAMMRAQAAEVGAVVEATECRVSATLDELKAAVAELRALSAHARGSGSPVGKA